jgi:predicted O-methyltransferase YrrM
MNTSIFEGRIPEPGEPEKFLRTNFWPLNNDNIEQREFYYAIAAAHKPKTVLEIGVLGGRSMIAMLSGCECTVEGWDLEQYERNSNSTAASNLAALGLMHRVTLKTVNSQTVNTFPKFDMIHVDGDHSFHGALRDLQLASESTKVILYDDIFNKSTQCEAAFEEFLKTHRDRIAWHCVLPHETGLAWILLR